MKEELITFETAKLANEKGFDWRVNALYTNEYSKNDEYELITTLTVTKSNQIHAPTQSLLQRWLREVHSIHVNVDTGWADGGFLYECTIWNRAIEIQCKLSLNSILGTYELTYEEALEAGLLEALKLIEDGG